VAAETLGLPLESIRVMPTRTDKVPNTSATAASASSDLNGAAVVDACRKIQANLTPVATSLLECAPDAVRYQEGSVFAAEHRAGAIPFRRLVEAACLRRVPLFAQGYYRTPEIQYDPKTGQGHPFYYYVYGAAVSEVEVDGFTGESKILRVDILEDAGQSLSPLVDRGQIEGGFIQGAGWLTLEELVWDAEGRLATNGASTYKLPSWSELPETFNVDMLERAAEPGVVYGSKAVGEPPLMLAISVREAIREATAAFGRGGIVEIDTPSTPERIFFAIERVRPRRLAPRRQTEAIQL
jgi:xanthine dehydrogenase large subunit